MAALAFLLANQNITTAICGAKSPEEIEEDAAAGDFMPSKSAAIAQAEGFSKLGGKFCTTCGYCMPCPQGVNIPQAMLNWNYWKLYDIDFSKWSKSARKKLLDSVGFDKCTECALCEGKCTNALPIIQRLKELERVLSSADR
jgi:predicted aldo/keto reductase-like oxidoreductase